MDPLLFGYLLLDQVAGSARVHTAGKRPVDGAFLERKSSCVASPSEHLSLHANEMGNEFAVLLMAVTKPVRRLHDAACIELAVKHHDRRP